MSQIAIERTIRKMRQEVREAAENLIRCEQAMDFVMKKPESHERGKQMAAIANQIQLITDSLLHFTLGWEFPKMRSHRRKIEAVRASHGKGER